MARLFVAYLLSYTGSAMAQLGMAALFLTDNATVGLLTGLMLVNGVAIALNAPAATGLIVQLVDKNQPQANTSAS